MNTKLNSLFIIIFSVSITCNYATEKNTPLNKGPEKVSGNENTKIYTVFMSPGGHFGTGGAPESLTTNQELLLQIQTKCDGIDFIARDMTNPDISIENVYRELDSLKEDIDGVLIIGELHVEWPVGEPVTFWKVYVMHNKIEVFTGKTVDGHLLYKNLDDIMCRTKLIARVKAKPVQQHFSPDEYGIHRTATLGDLREKIKDLAILIGFDVMETDTN